MNEQEMIERCRSLPERFAGRIGDGTLRRTRFAALGGEYRLLVLELIAGLDHRGAWVTDAERAELRELIEAVCAEPALLDRINSAGACRPGRVERYL